ncbi:MAG: DUF1800 domain-containing protein [Planctomycetota bacterium]
MPPTKTRNWDASAATHVLGRVGFGADRERVRRAVEEGFEATLSDLETRRAHSAAMTSKSVERLVSLGNLQPLQARWMALILGDGAPLLERVTLMWHGHFATSNAKVGDVKLMHRQNELFRTKGLGDFRELLHDVAKDPAMLVWLDGNRNRVGAPNENFAREVMELFGLGIGDGYDEDDIKEAARAFSGWTVTSRRFSFRREYHDDGEKSMFGRGGVFTGEQAIERLLEHPECSRWIARRLLTTFVLPEPSREDVERWGEVLVEEDWNVGQTLARLFRDPLFLSDRARRSRIRGPVELVAAVALATRAEVAPADAVRAASSMGQTLFVPPTVKGWDGGRAWIDPGTWLARHNLMARYALGDKFDVERTYGRLADRRAAVVAACELLLPGAVPAPMRATLAAAAEDAPSTEAAARRVTALVLTSPEYHLA